MKNSFTLNDLIQFAFHVTQNAGNINDGEMETDEEIQKHFNDMMGMNSWKEGSFPAPEQRIINNILNYSRSLSVYNLKSIGVMNVLLN
jgi:hypothetical protein